MGSRPSREDMIDMEKACSSLHEPKPEKQSKETSDGSSADYYKLPPYATQLQHLIAYKNMNAQMGEIFRATYRYGEVAHSEMERDLRKIIFYAEAELDRLARLKQKETPN